MLEPIFEADFCPTCSGFRPGRRAQDAIEEMVVFINPPGGYEWVIEGDIENCFGCDPPRTLDGNGAPSGDRQAVLTLIRQFLAAGVMSELGTVTASPSGTPQGVILSPLLRTSPSRSSTVTSRRPGERSVDRRSARSTGRRGMPLTGSGFADDFLLIVAGIGAQAEALEKQTTEFMAEQMRMTLSAEKTQSTHVDDGFDFLGLARQTPVQAGSSASRDHVPERPRTRVHQDPH